MGLLAMDYYEKLYEQRDRDIEHVWPAQITGDTRNDWWHGILKRSGARDRGLLHSKDYVRAIEEALAENDDRDLNKLDSRGKTALHAAVRSRNTFAVLALLQCGADINVVDVHGHTAPTCVELKDRRGEVRCLKHHVKKLIAFGMYVSELNITWYCASLMDEDVWVGSADRALIESWRSRIDGNIPGTIKYCSIGVEKMKAVEVNGRTTLYRVFCDGAERLAYSPMKLRELEKIIRADDFHVKFGFFGEFGDLIPLVYRRACSRRKLLPAVENALQVLLKIHLPSPCSEAVVENLSDFDVARVIEAADFKQD